MVRRHVFAVKSPSRTCEPKEMRGVDYAMLVRKSTLSDEELAERLGLPIGKIRKMRKLEYIPQDEDVRRRIVGL